MSDRNDSASCAKNCWIMGAIAGLVLAVLMLVIAGWSFFGALLLGVVFAVIAALLLKFYLCGNEQATGSTSAQSSATSADHTTSAQSSTAQAASSDMSSSVSTAAAPAAAAPVAKFADIKPSKDLPGQAELASRKGDWKYEGEPAAKKAAPKKAAAKKAAPKKAAATAKAAAPAKKTAAKAAAPAKTATAKAAAPAKKATAKQATAKASSANSPDKPKRAAPAPDGKPQLLASAPTGGGNDLKLISGVGPKLEQTLNEMGIYQFEQVAGWRKKEIEWVDSRLRFKGRIVRDDWVSQAKILAKGGETEFSKRKK